MPKYQERFGECVDGICTLSTTRQSAITGLLSVGAVIGAVGSGTVADRVSFFFFMALFSFQTSRPKPFFFDSILNKSKSDLKIDAYIMC